MLIMERIGEVQGMCFEEGVGYKTIARELRLSKNVNWRAKMTP